jgi:acetyl-CoA carboxylase carboxyl transferase subunit beta
MTSDDPLSFKFRGTTYKKRIKEDEKKSSSKEAMLIGKAFVKGRGVVLAVMEPNFLMGSMGSVVGEKFCAAVDLAIEEKLPLVVVSCSGGARMHEGVVSLGQMAKTSAALAKLDEACGLYICVLTDPTTGGVTASFAMLGDCLIAEPGALIGFAGPRTIAETIKVELPEGFQTAEFMLEHGFVDMIVHRKDLRSEIARLIDYCRKYVPCVRCLQVKNLKALAWLHLAFSCTHWEVLQQAVSTFPSRRFATGRGKATGSWVAFSPGLLSRWWWRY